MRSRSWKPRSEEDLRGRPRHPHRDRRLRRHRGPRDQRRRRVEVRLGARMGRRSSASPASACTRIWRAGWPPSAGAQPSRSSGRGSDRGRDWQTSWRRSSSTCSPSPPRVGGIALALQLAAGVGPGWWIPVALFAVWIVVWRTKFSIMENVTGLLGLTLLVFVVALFLLKPDWGKLVEPAVAAVGPGIRQPDVVLVLRRRAVRRRDDAVRGLLLLVGCGRGEMEEERPGDRTSQRVHRVSARRHPFARDRRLRSGRAPAAGDRSHDPVTGRAPRRAGGRSAGSRVRHCGDSRRHVRRCTRDDAVVAATPSRSSSDGAGANSEGPHRRHASTSR